MANIHSIEHVSLLVSDVATSLDFYCRILGLGLSDARPDLGYPGAWLTVGQQQIHLLQLPDPCRGQQRPAHGGRDHHIAFQVVDLELLAQRLLDQGTAITRSRSGRQAFFCRDPDGNALEFIAISHQTMP